MLDLKSGNIIESILIGMVENRWKIMILWNGIIKIRDRCKVLNNVEHYSKWKWLRVSE